MEITDVEAIALVWLAPDRECWTSVSLRLGIELDERTLERRGSWA